MNFLYVGLGGAAGSVVRYYLDKYISSKVKTRYPVGIFTINLMGAFLLGLVQNILQNPANTLFIATGFLGAFTTFSTFLWQSYSLINDSERRTAYYYIALSILCGVVFFVLGYKLGSMF